jgi:hypothetical protein
MKTPIKLLYQKRNPLGITADANVEENKPDYREIRIGCYRNGHCIADIFVGLCDTNEIRVLITADSEGDSDHQIAVYPMRKVSEAVDFNV